MLITKKRRVLQGKQMTDLFLVILRRQDILSGHILKQERDEKLSSGTMWKKAPLQNYCSFHPNVAIRNQVLQQEVL